jgi:Flp pilus assembly protein TadD
VTCLGGTTAAVASVDARSPLALYVHARAAAAAGADDQASAGFAAVLDASPDNNVVAAQALSYGVHAGDWPLALRAAHILERNDALLPDARFLLLAEAFRTGDWAAAKREIDAIEGERLFAFAVPVLRAWLAYGSHRGDPLAALAGGHVPPAYATEHRALLLLAMGRSEGPAQLAAAAGAQTVRAMRLRIAGAATLVGRGDKAGALALLQGDDPPMVVARAAVEAGRPLRGAITGANSGVGEFLVQLAIDLDARNLTPVGATFARLTTWLDPDNSEGWIVAAELLARNHQPGDALALLARVPADDPFASTVRDERASMLVDSGDGEAALAQAREIAAAPGARASDHARVGQILMALNQPAEAAAAFAQAIAVRTAADDTPEWSLLLARAGALDAAGNWPEARGVLERAYRIAPTQPLVLNYLGYGQLDHHENMAEAERLVREAHRLAPDSPAITDSLGWALFLKGDHAGAVTLLEAAARGAPADVEINEHLGDAYYAVGRRLEARFAWRAARVYAEGEDAARLDAKIQGGPAAQAAR